MSFKGNGYTSGYTLGYKSVSTLLPHQVISKKKGGYCPPAL